MPFSRTNLTGNRVLVDGTDQFGTINKIVLDATQWNELNAVSACADAHEAYDAAVKKFYAPLVKASEALNDAHNAVRQDDVWYVEGTKAVAGVPDQAIQLSHDSTVLRLLENGAEDRLVWVGDALEILELPAVKAKKSAKKR